MYLCAFVNRKKQIKITKLKLQQIIKEEFESIVSEGPAVPDGVVGAEVQNVVLVPEADETGVEHARQCLGDVGLADTGFALDQQRALELPHERNRHRQIAICDIAGGGQSLLQFTPVHRHWNRVYE